MGIKLILILFFLKLVKNEIIHIKNVSSCLNDACGILDGHFSHEILESTTDNNLLSDLLTEKENEDIVKIGEISQKIGNDPESLNNTDDSQNDLYIIKPSNPMMPNDSLNESNNVELRKGEDTSNMLKEKPNGTELVTEIKTSTTETPKYLLNDTIANKTKEIHQSRYHHSVNQSEICSCDLKVNDCDVNCCCDRDCNAQMQMVFTTCIDSAEKTSSQFCFNSASIFKNNLQNEKNGLLCVVRNNLHPYVKFREEMIIDNVTNFNKKISRKKFYSYYPLQFNNTQMQKIPYKFGDIIWSLSQNETSPFGVLKHDINMLCKYKKNIFYLIDYETECLHSVPKNKERCLTATHLGMEYFLGNKLIKSPAQFSSTNSSDQVCNNKTCIEITPYICSDDSDLSSCMKSSPKRLDWNKNCKNLVSSIEYHIYHNGTDGLKEARAYFTLKAFETESFLQKIKLKFLWVNTRSQVFKRSGNPGYIIGKPIISGRKIYSNNDTMPVRKEAIELSYNPAHWLTVVGSQSGVCSSFNRRSVGFGENAHYSCFVDMSKFDYQKRNCIDLQEIFYQLLLGDDFAEIKTNNLNKFVATFGNSEVENTGDWVQVIVDAPSMISGQTVPLSNSDYFICKNIVSDLLIDVVYSKVGSIEKPQNKILGVRIHFGSPKNFVYNIKQSFSRFRSSQNIKLSTYVHFIDLTRKARAVFAETPGFEAKLPHDFFYPFFSFGCINSANSFIIFVIIMIIHLMK